eukprot:INCI5146.15.p1 GENE.INCI5146.15~~INCI5146.15.p1  ORF type:complete len:901 (-),score=139.23 INCI5146.15:3278-5980(-)
MDSFASSSSQDTASEDRTQSPWEAESPGSERSKSGFTQTTATAAPVSSNGDAIGTTARKTEAGEIPAIQLFVDETPFPAFQQQQQQLLVSHDGMSVSTAVGPASLGALAQSAKRGMAQSEGSIAQATAEHSMPLTHAQGRSRPSAQSPNIGQVDARVLEGRNPPWRDADAHEITSVDSATVGGARRHLPDTQPKGNDAERGSGGYTEIHSPEARARERLVAVSTAADAAARAAADTAARAAAYAEQLRKKGEQQPHRHRPASQGLHSASAKGEVSSQDTDAPADVVDSNSKSQRSDNDAHAQVEAAPVTYTSGPLDPTPHKQRRAVERTQRLVELRNDAWKVLRALVRPVLGEWDAKDRLDLPTKYNQKQAQMPSSPRQATACKGLREILTSWAEGNDSGGHAPADSIGFSKASAADARLPTWVELAHVRTHAKFMRPFVSPSLFEHFLAGVENFSELCEELEHEAARHASTKLSGSSSMPFSTNRFRQPNDSTRIGRNLPSKLSFSAALSTPPESQPFLSSSVHNRVHTRLPPSGFASTYKSKVIRDARVMENSQAATHDISRSRPEATLDTSSFCVDMETQTEVSTAWLNASDLAAGGDGARVAGSAGEAGRKGIKVGDRISIVEDEGVDGDSSRLHDFCRPGVVRFLGETYFADGEWIGVELRYPDGRNDGSIEGHRYFHCHNNRGLSANLNYGLFVRRNKIHCADECFQLKFDNQGGPAEAGDDSQIFGIEDTLSGPNSAVLSSVLLDTTLESPARTGRGGTAHTSASHRTRSQPQKSTAAFRRGRLDELLAEQDQELRARHFPSSPNNTSHASFSPSSASFVGGVTRRQKPPVSRSELRHSAGKKPTHRGQPAPHRHSSAVLETVSFSHQRGRHNSDSERADAAAGFEEAMRTLK